MKRIWKYIIPVFSLVLLCLRIYSNIIYHIPLAKREIFVILLLSVIFFYNNRITWHLGIILFLYGIYSMLGIIDESWTSTTMLFTVAIDYAFPKLCSKNGIGEKCLTFIIPNLFYVIALISFFTKPVRLYYGWKQKSDRQD